MKNYTATIVINNVSTIITFETDENPIEYLWGHYGMDTYISSVTEVENDLDYLKENDV